MAREQGTSIVWRIAWGIAGAGLTAVVLSVSGLDLSPPLLAAASAGAGIAVAIVGPALLDLLGFF